MLAVRAIIFHGCFAVLDMPKLFGRQRTYESGTLVKEGVEDCSIRWDSGANLVMTDYGDVGWRTASIGLSFNLPIFRLFLEYINKLNRARDYL